MASLLNKNRPPVFCPGCSHERVLKGLDKAFQNLRLKGHQIAMVSDIGCSGLFDTFFNTHAFHGLHGRALTYATGLKLARPELNVIVTMGDGGMGIGGAHFLSACRRNLDLTLIVLNNFNFGMTGGQFSATTPTEAIVSSGFLNALEMPLDICNVAIAAGATYVSRCSAYEKKLVTELQRAIQHKGFAIVDTWGICTGRYLKKNRLTPDAISSAISQGGEIKGPVYANERREYGGHYREMAAKCKAPEAPSEIPVQFQFKGPQREEVVILGDAGQRIITCGEILCLAGVLSGRKVTQKNEYNITVLRGPSISEVILSTKPIGYTGIVNPSVVIAIGQEGVNRRMAVFSRLTEDTLVLQGEDISLPQTQAKILTLDFRAHGIKASGRALGALGVLARLNRALNPEILQAALHQRFKGDVLSASLELIQKVYPDQ